MLSAFSARTAPAEQQSPTFRPPGSSLAARAAVGPARLAPGARPLGAAAGERGASERTEWGSSQRLGADAGDAGQGRCSAGAAAAPPPAAACGAAWPAQRKRWADEDLPCDASEDEEDEGYREDDMAWEAEEEEECYDDQHDQEGDVVEPPPHELRALWVQECRVVKRMLHQGCPESSAAYAAACAARDEAEARWRRAKKPQPISVRMGWAQRNLDKAERSLAKARCELEEFEEQCDRRRQELRQRIEEADDRYRRRTAEMDSLHAEAGELAATSKPRGPGGGGGGDVGDMALRDYVANELLAIVETMEEGTDARGRANLLLARVTAKPSQDDGAEEHYIGDAGRPSGGDAGDQRGDNWQLVGKGRKGRKPRGECTHEWREETYGRWNRRETSSGEGSGGKVGDHQGAQVREAAMDGTGQGNGASRDRDGTTPGKATGKGQPTATATTTRGTRAREGDEAAVEGERDGKSHRGHDLPATAASADVGSDDATRARKLYEEQALAIEAARRANAEFVDEQSRQIAGQLYAHKVDLVRARAEAVGVRPMAGEKQLIELAPQDFVDWIRTHLEPAEAAAGVEASGPK